MVMESYLFNVGEVPPLKDKLTLCLGNFDGIHRGHQALILEARKEADGPLGVLLFDDNPARYFPNGKSARVLTSLEDKKRHFAALGVDVAYVIHIDQAFFGLSKDAFIRQVLAPLKPKRLVVGADYSFGEKAAGGLEDLRKLFPVTSVPLLNEYGQKISTQSIIRAIEKGEIARANSELGYPYEISGVVGHGYENGRKLGFPTANLVLSIPYVYPQDGVYLALIYLRGIPHKALVNVGKNPTIGLLKEPVIECYLSDLKEMIYGETLYVDFLKKLRDEVKFASREALEAQMEKDKEALR
jgi:riboflavin kinase/FMN adenylyltransferase